MIHVCYLFDRAYVPFQWLLPNLSRPELYKWPLFTDGPCNGTCIITAKCMKTAFFVLLMWLMWEPWLFHCFLCAVVIFFCSSCVSVYWRCLFSFLYLMPWRVLGLPRVCVFVWLPLVQHLCCYLFYGWWCALLCVCLHSKSAVYVEYAYMCAVLICHCCIVCIWLMYLLLCVHAWHCICVCVCVCLSAAAWLR